MVEKVGRNDPCSCGSGKKFKNCCFQKTVTIKPKITAKWINKANAITPSPIVKAPQPAPSPLPQDKDKPIDLMERAFGAAIALGKMTERPLFLSRSNPEKKPEEPIQ